MDLSAGAAIREDALSAAAGACCCQGAAAVMVVPLLRCCCCCYFNGDCSSCLFTCGHISYWYDISRASYYLYYYCCINLLSVQSQAPASSLAEPAPTASPQLGRWVGQQGLRSARIRGLLLLLAAASGAAAAASTTTALPCLFTFGHFSYWYGRNITTVVTASAGRYGIRVTLLFAMVRVARGTAW